MKNSTRESNFDLLRIIATFAVIVLHTSATYVNAMTDVNVFGSLYEKHIFSTSLVNGIVRFAVPCFIMLSGAFILSDDKNREYKYFYGKSFKNIGIQTIVFSVLYVMYSLATTIAVMVIKGRAGSLLTPFISALQGEPFYHMWYLYMLIGLYALAPLVIRFKETVDRKKFSGIVWIFLIIASLSGWTGDHRISWDVGMSFCYMGYFLAGYELRRMFADKKSNIKGAIFILAGFMVEFVSIGLYYINNIKGINDDKAVLSMIEPFCPIIVLASVLIFAGFSMLKVNINLSKISGKTFYIYLFHGLVWSLVCEVFKMTGGVKYDSRLVIIFGSIVTFVVSYFMSAVYMRLINLFKKK